MSWTHRTRISPMRHPSHVLDVLIFLPSRQNSWRKVVKKTNSCAEYIISINTSKQKWYGPTRNVPTFYLGEKCARYLANKKIRPSNPGHPGHRGETPSRHMSNTRCTPRSQYPCPADRGHGFGTSGHSGHGADKVPGDRAPIRVERGDLRTETPWWMWACCECSLFYVLKIYLTMI
jgi:hypothetical protein